MNQVALAPGGSLQDPWLSDLAERIWAKPEFSMVPIDVEAGPRGPYSRPPVADARLRIVFCGIPPDYGTAFLLQLVEQRANIAAAGCSTRWQRTHPNANLIARTRG